MINFNLVSGSSCELGDTYYVLSILLKLKEVTLIMINFLIWLLFLFVLYKLRPPLFIWFFFLIGTMVILIRGKNRN
jgi:hypothetical protein